MSTAYAAGVRGRFRWPPDAKLSRSNRRSDEWMAEEIITTWSNVNDLFMEFIIPGETNIKNVARDMLDGSPQPGSMQLRLVEASSGREVQFPLKLISNTKLAVNPKQK